MKRKRVYRKRFRYSIQISVRDHFGTKLHWMSIISRRKYLSIKAVYGQPYKRMKEVWCGSDENVKILGISEFK